MSAVEVITGSRLHFGLLCGGPDSGWHYGGIGMMIDAPAWHIHASCCGAAQDDVAVSESIESRVRNLLAEFRQAYDQLPPVRITTRSAARLHSGLGSGTQLTLAVGTALLLLSGRPRPTSIAEFAATLGRSRRSAIGTFGFDHGGLIVDYGKAKSGTQQPPDRIRFPDEWRMVIVSPERSMGLSGQTEENFFCERRYLESATVAEFDHLIRARMIPAVQSESFEHYRAALADYGQLVGEYYAAAQGGVFGSPVIRKLAKSISAGMVQSSWGPSVAIPASCEQEAADIESELRSLLSDDEVSIQTVRGLNHGATIRTVAPDGHRSFG